MEFSFYYMIPDTINIKEVQVKFHLRKQIFLSMVII
jgi:hypothetical protein